MKVYNHLYSLLFSVTTPIEDPDKVPGELLRCALIKRVNPMPTNEFEEACANLDDSHVEDDIQSDEDLKKFSVQYRRIHKVFANAEIVAIERAWGTEKAKKGKP
jgi:hypothetical protein